MRTPIFIVGPHRTGSTLWHNVIAMCPGVMRLTDPRFLSDKAHKDFRYFLKSQVGDLAVDENVDRMIELCFARTNLPGLDSTFWRFENIQAANDPELRQAISRRIKQSDRSLGAIARIFIEEITRFSGCDRACVKFPVDIGHIPELLQLVPGLQDRAHHARPARNAMSKRNDPSGTALRVRQHPRLTWLIQKLSLWLIIAQYRRTARVHHRFQHLPNYKLFCYEDLLAEPERTLKRTLPVYRCGIHGRSPSSGTRSPRAPTLQLNRETTESLRRKRRRSMADGNAGHGQVVGHHSDKTKHETVGIQS